MRSCTIFLATLIFAFACDTSSNISAPDKSYFVKYFGGNGNQFAVNLIANNDGTFYILGNSRLGVDSLQQVYLAKADALGNEMWHVTYGTSGEYTAKDFVLSANSLIVVADSASTKGGPDTHIKLIRFSLLDGKVMQTATPQVLAQPSAVTRSNTISVLNDGGFLISGNTDYVGPLSNHTQDALHFRTDANFVQRTSNWSETSGQGVVNSVTKGFQATSGITYEFGNTNATSTNTIDQNFWAFGLLDQGGYAGGSDNPSEFVVNNSDEYVTSAQKVLVGGYLMTGVTIDKNSQSVTLKIIKLKYDDLALDATDVQFNYPGRSLGTLKPGVTPFATACNSSSGYLILSDAYNTSGSSDMALIKLGVSLKEIWDSPVYLGGDGDDASAAVAELPDGRIMVLGTMNLGKPAEQYKIALIKLNPQGRIAD